LVVSKLGFNPRIDDFSFLKIFPTSLKTERFSKTFKAIDPNLIILLKTNTQFTLVQTFLPFPYFHQGEKKDNCLWEMVILLTTLFQLLGKCLRLHTSKK
jgi:hypothetical protein